MKEKIKNPSLKIKELKKQNQRQRQVIGEYRQEYIGLSEMLEAQRLMLEECEGERDQLLERVRGLEKQLKETER